MLVAFVLYSFGRMVKFFSDVMQEMEFASSLRQSKVNIKLCKVSVVCHLGE